MRGLKSLPRFAPKPEEWDLKSRENTRPLTPLLMQQTPLQLSEYGQKYRQHYSQQLEAMATKMQPQQESADVRTRGGLEEWRVDQILENMSTPLVVWYYTATIRDPHDPTKTTVVPDESRPESPDKRILRGRIFQSILKAVSLEFS